FRAGHTSRGRVFPPTRAPVTSARAGSPTFSARAPVVGSGAKFRGAGQRATTRFRLGGRATSHTAGRIGESAPDCRCPRRAVSFERARFQRRCGIRSARAERDTEFHAVVSGYALRRGASCRGGGETYGNKTPGDTAARRRDAHAPRGGSGRAGSADDGWHQYVLCIVGRARGWVEGGALGPGWRRIV